MKSPSDLDRSTVTAKSVEGWRPAIGLITRDFDGHVARLKSAVDDRFSDIFDKMISNV